MGRRRESLIARRIHLDYTQESLAHRLSVSTATVTKWEHGTRLPSPGVRRSLAEALEVSLLDLDRLLGIEPPIELNGHKVPRWLNTYESLVQVAGQLGEVEFIAVPGLLQTKAYAEAAELASGVQLSADQLLAAIDLRIARQEILYRSESPLHLVTLLSEGVLLDPVGGPAVMVEQLDHLLEVGQRANIDLRLLGPGRAPSAIGGFELLTRQDDVDPFMAVTFSVAGPHYFDVEDQVAKFVARFEHLVSTSVPPDETARRIHDIRESYR
jgi:transcriptional regulator with XRE-family HTH domain